MSCNVQSIVDVNELKKRLMTSLRWESRFTKNKIKLKCGKKRFVATKTKIDLINIGSFVAIELEYADVKDSYHAEGYEFFEEASKVISYWIDILSMEGIEQYFILSKKDAYIPFYDEITSKFGGLDNISNVESLVEVDFIAAKVSLETKNRFEEFVKAKRKIEELLIQNSLIHFERDFNLNKLLVNYEDFAFCSNKYRLMFSDSFSSIQIFQLQQEGQLLLWIIDIDDNESFRQFLDGEKEKYRLKHLIKPPMVKFESLMSRLGGRLGEPALSMAFSCLEKEGFTWEEVEKESAEMLNNFGDSDYPMINLRDVHHQHSVSEVELRTKKTKKFSYFFLFYKMSVNNITTRYCDIFISKDGKIPAQIKVKIDELLFAHLM